MIDPILLQFEPVSVDDADCDNYIPSINPLNPLVHKEAKKFIRNCNQQIKILNQDYHPEIVMAIRTRMVDVLIHYIFNQFEQKIISKIHHQGPRAALIAQGGYGRKEMNICSDIDLLFIYPKRKGEYIETLTEKILYLLWDLGLEVGCATRTVGDCKQMLMHDVTIMTSLLDIRYLCGERAHFKLLKATLNQILHSFSIQKKLIYMKLEEKKIRVAKYGGSVFVLEPNIKECAGGLRDLHVFEWIAKIRGIPLNYKKLVKEGYLNKAEAKTLMMARNFLWRVRNEVHLLVKSKIDLLTFERQQRIAKNLGYKDSLVGILAVEKFMQTYYQLAHDVYSITDRAMMRMLSKGGGLSGFFKRMKAKKIDQDYSIVDGQISVKNKLLFKNDPVQMLRIFTHVQEKALPLSPETRDLIRSHAHLICDKHRANPVAIKEFRGMMQKYKRLGDVLLMMHDTHLLDEWIPEFKKLRCRVQHDIYHIYTIDTHSIFAVNELSKLDRGEYGDKFKFYSDLLKSVQNPELLTLSLFLHDIGKGEGGQHSIKGALIAKRITNRLQMNQEECGVVDFLIQSHLMMPHLSQRRDLDDSELIIKFARSIESVDKLNMLTLLSWADMRAVGPEAWTDWKGILLEKLYNKTKEVIVKGEFSKEKTIERVNRIKNLMVEKLSSQYSKEDFQTFLSMMPPRYYFAVEESDVERHYKIYKNSKTREIISECEKKEGLNLFDIYIYTINSPKVFSQLTGVMLAYGINIIHADVFQTYDGHIFVIMRVTSNALDNPLRFQQIQKSLEEVLCGKVPVHKLISRQKIPRYLEKKPVQKAKSVIIIDNDISVYNTVIDVYAHDRLGLLYDITKVLYDHGCYIDVSKISTKVEQVADVFYVKDIFGKKILAPEKKQRLKQALSRVIEMKNPA